MTFRDLKEKISDIEKNTTIKEDTEIEIVLMKEDDFEGGFFKVIDGTYYNDFYDKLKIFGERVE